MRRVKTVVTIILISLGVSTLFWTLDSAIMSEVLHMGTFFEQVFQPDMHHLWMRTPVVILSFPLVVLLVFLGRKSAEVKSLKGLIPICAWCGKKIRDEEGNWKRVEEYIRERSTAEFTHGMCPECYSKHLTEEDNKKEAGTKR